MTVLCDVETLEAQVGQLTQRHRGPGCGDSPPDDLGEALLRLGQVVERLSALRAVWADQFESGSQWAVDGARSGSAWVAARAIEHPAAARARMHAGRDLRALPQVAQAALSGRFGSVMSGSWSLLPAPSRTDGMPW